jgi:Family of unknown function (DUF5677)
MPDETEERSQGVDPAWHARFARSLTRFAAEIQPAAITWSDDREQDAQRFWMVGFLIAGRRMLETIVLLTENGYGGESDAQLRCLLELVGNVNYMTAAPGRGIDFAIAESLGRKRLSELLQKYEWGDEEERKEFAASVVEELEEVASVVGADIERDELAGKPFGVDARTRIESSPTMPWHYDLVFSTTSDLLHMNALAVAKYLRNPSPETYGKVTVASELFLRVLYAADTVLHLGKRNVIDGYAVQYAKETFPERPPSVFLGYVRGK